MTTYTTTTDYITQTIAPALGEHAQDFDMEAIADDMLTWKDGQLVENEHEDFWEITAKHDQTAPIMARVADSFTQPVDMNGDWSITEDVDIVEITRNDVEIATIKVESCEESGPYDEAVEKALGHANYVWSNN